VDNYSFYPQDLVCAALKLSTSVNIDNNLIYML